MIRQDVRKVKLTPKKLQTNSCLGAEIKFERFDDAFTKVFKVSDVLDNSPAFQSGLADPNLGGEDYIILVNNHTVEDLD